MEFKGTKGEWKVKNKENISNDNVKGIIASAWTVYDSEPVEICQDGESWLSMRIRTEPIREKAEQEREANAQLIADAGNVRQQIDCSLPELLKRYKKMEEALKEFEDFKEDVIQLMDESNFIALHFKDQLDLIMNRQRSFKPLN